MAKKPAELDDMQMENAPEEKAEKSEKKAERVLTPMEANLQATKLLRAKKKEVNPDALLGQIEVLKAKLKRAQSV